MNQINLDQVKSNEQNQYDSDEAQARWRRICWRARRGMLENDLLLSRFLSNEKQAPNLTEMELSMLDDLLDLPDGELLNVFLAFDASLAEPSEPEQAAKLCLIRKIIESSFSR